jgi:integrase
MPRPRAPYWHDRDKCYKTRIDGVETILRNRDGTKVAHGDDRGKREAVDQLLAVRDAAERRAIDPTVEDLCGAYLVACSRDCELETMHGKEWVLAKFCAHGSPPYGNRPAKDIDAVDLHRMRKAWESEGYSGGMLRRLYREVMACWSWAARPEPERSPVVILAKNPMAGLRLPLATPRSEKYLPMSAIRGLIAYAEGRPAGMGPLRGRFERQAVLMLRLLAETGCRPKEACTARWADLDATQGLIVLRNHKTAKKTGRLRTIVVPSGILADLVALRDSGHAHPVHLFAHARSRGEMSRGAARETGAPWTRPGYTSWFLALTRGARAKGIELPEEITLYWLRHSYLTDAQMSLSSESAANLAGNTKEMARGTYLHAQAAELRIDAERVAKRRGGE